MNINIGAIGFGWMAYDHFKKIIPKGEGVSFTAAYDIDSARLEFAQELGLKPYGNLQKFLQSEDFDTVLVATPNDSHKNLCIEALRAGKHVICEKPATLNAAELEEIIAVSKEVQKLFTVHHNRRRDRDFCIVKKAVSDGLLGKVFSIESRVQGANGIPGDWRRCKESGGGMLLDWGVHLTDQLLRLIDSPVTSVYARLNCVNYTVDDNIKILLQFENGISAQIDVMTACFLPLPRWQVLGSEGTLQIKNWECEGSIVRGAVDEVDWSLEAIKNAAGSTRTMRPRPKSTVESLPLPEVDADWQDFYRNFKQAVEGKAKLNVQPEQVLRTAKVIDLCFQSAREAKSIDHISI